MSSQLEKIGPAELTQDHSPRVATPLAMSSEKMHGCRTGSLIAVSAQRLPTVDYPGNPARVPLDARTCVQLHADDVGKQVLIMFEDGDAIAPIVVGVLWAPASTQTACAIPSAAEALEGAAVEVDGRILLLTAKESLTLRCGGSSITLTRDGKVLIRGEYLQSRSNGVNRIQGGSVQIN